MKPNERDRQAAARCWCHETTSGKEMDSALAEQIAAALAAARLEGVRALTFDQLRAVNVDRCEGPTFSHRVEDWSPTDWACAVAGEVGEACNFIKKQRRGEAVPVKAIADELADAIIYLDLLAARLGIDLGNAVTDKFNEVSRRRGSDVFLPSDAERIASDGR